MWGMESKSETKNSVLLSPKAASLESPSIETIIDAFNRSTLSLLEKNIVKEEQFIRPEEREILSCINEKDGTTVFLLGRPGSGKTSLLAKIAADAVEQKIITVAIRADMFPPNTDFSDWEHSILDLKINMFDAIKSVSIHSKVLLIVDQLDALASTVDLTSNRLNQILNLIKKCGKLPNVSVICSSREFDYNFDTRLQTITSESILLENLQWNTVEQKLSKHGISVNDAWPETFKELLCTPQYLTIYIQQYLKSGGKEVYDSYQIMLDNFWSQNINHGTEQDFVYRLTSDLLNSEAIWAPIIKYDEYKNTIDTLIDKKILLTDRAQIGFAHQTLFEHAKARLFLTKEISLASYLLEENRQESILVRPTVLSVLNYLRHADKAQYQKDLNKLFRSKLRLHIRYLLIEFIGQKEEPEELEIFHLANCLRNEDDRTRVLIAIRGKQNWFHALCKSHFPTLMDSTPHTHWQMSRVLIEAWEFAYEDCLSLINDYWLYTPEHDELIYRILSECDSWNDETIAIAQKIVTRSNTKVERCWWIEDLIYSIAKHQPVAAARLIPDALPTLSNQNRCPLESHDGWYNLSDVASAAPLEFLRNTWPWILQVSKRFHQDQYYSKVLYRYSGYCGALDDDNFSVSAPILDAIIIAIDKTAGENPEDFVKITKEAWPLDIELIHRLVIRGLTKCTKQMPSACLDYIVGDRRRFCLGTVKKFHQSDSCKLISELFPCLDIRQKTILTETILKWSSYRKNIELCEDQLLWDREYRLRLLKAIPEEFMNIELQKFVTEEEIKFPNWDREAFQTRGGFISQISPISRDDMSTTSDNEIIDALNLSNTDSPLTARKAVDGGWEEPGGAHAASIELSEYAKDNPLRVLSIIRKQIENKKYRYLGNCISNLSEANIANGELFDQIIQIAKTEIESQEVRLEFSHLLSNRGSKTDGLPDDICNMLESWLAMPWDSNIDFLTYNDNQESDWNGKESILWDLSRRNANFGGSYNTLVALTIGYLRKEPSATGHWLNMLDHHLDRDIPACTWDAFLPHLKWLARSDCDSDRSLYVFNKLIQKYPSLVERQEGLRLIANISEALPPTDLQNLFSLIRGSSSPFSLQAYGELLTLVAFRADKHEWTQHLLESEIELICNNYSSEIEPLAIGIAFSAARLWDQFKVSKLASNVLCQLIPIENERVSNAIGSVFWATEMFAADEHFQALLNTLSKHPKCLNNRFVSYLIEHLVEIIPHLNESILELCNVIVDTKADELTNFAFDLYTVGPDLVNISMTLQRLENTREGGLTLLEKLLRLGLDDAFTILEAIDDVPFKSSSQQRKARRPRSRRRRR